MLLEQRLVRRGLRGGTCSSRWFFLNSCYLSGRECASVDLLAWNTDLTLNVPGLALSLVEFFFEHYPKLGDNFWFPEEYKLCGTFLIQQIANEILIHEFHNLSWITEIKELFHDILIYWDVPEKNYVLLNFQSVKESWINVTTISTKILISSQHWW